MTETTNVQIHPDEYHLFASCSSSTFLSHDFVFVYLRSVIQRHAINGSYQHKFIMPAL